VDFSDAMLPAAYGNYPISYNGNTKYSSNYAGIGLDITDSETFDSTKTYFGMFDPLGCYSEGTNDFTTRVAKATISTACSSATQWDGNFMNWLVMRKIDAAKKVLIGGRTLSASNNDGTANTLLGEPKTGQNGSTNTCNNSSDPCYRFVKFVRSSQLTGRYNTSLSAADTAWQSTGTTQGTGVVKVEAGALRTVKKDSTVSATTFTTTFAVGDTITIGAQSRTITAIASATSLTVGSAFTGLDITSSTYSGTRVKNPGTVAVSAGSTTVTGTGTSFTTTLAVGNVIKAGTQIRRVTAIGSATSLTVEPAFTSAVAAGTGYDVFVQASGTVPGTVTTNASPNANKVSGSSTDFKATSTYPVAVGDVMQIGSGATAQFQVISAVTNDTSVTASLDWSPRITTATAYLVYQPASSTALTGPGVVDVLTAGAGLTVTAAASPGTATNLNTFSVGQTIQIGTGGSAQTATVATVVSSDELTVTSDLTAVSNQSYFNVSASLQGPGTVTTDGTTTVTGTGTTFTSRFVAGEKIRINGTDYTIASITSDTVLVTTVAVPAASGATYNGPDGVYFGSGEGKLYVNGDADADPFDAAASRQFTIRVDLSSETDAFRQAQSWGLLQNLRTDNMRVAVMFANANGKAGTLFRAFDGIFNASAITGIRNQDLSANAALAEATYEGLCYYRNSQGACYSNSPADFTASVGAQGDPYFFVSSNQTVSCCKSFILMISSGIPTGDGNTPDSTVPFGDLLSTGTSNKGLTTTQLDDVAYYGNTNDVRNQGTGVTGNVANTQNVVFYSVNAMGGASGASVLSSAAKFGGFTDQNGDSLPDAGSQACTFPSGSNLGSGASTSSAEWDVDKDCTPDTFFDASQGSDLATQINNAIAAILKKASSGTSVSVLATSSTGEGAIYQAYFLPETAKVDGTSNTVKWYGFTQGLFIDTFGNIREDTDHDGRLVLGNDKIVSLSFNSATGDVVVLRCPDADGNGIADTTTVGSGLCANVSLSDIQPIWEAGARLAYLDPGTSCTTALAGSSCRRILTWADADYDKVVDSGEVIELTAANKATLCPYLAASTVLYCTSTNATLIDGAAITGDASLTHCFGLTRATCAQTVASNLITFHRGGDGTILCTDAANPASCLRDRSSAVRDPDNPAAAAVQKVWKYGDVVDSTPTVVGSPKERYDTIYGDATYTTYFKQYKTRRQVAYAGANDGMLHALNAGFFTEGDDASTTPVEHGYFSTTAPSSVSSYTTPRSSNPKLGAELWAFVPQELLPHLKWYADINYTHVAYVDLKPKVTDVRVFCGDSATGGLGSPTTCITGQPGAGIHPGGWGTILIGGMRYGGSCGACVTGSTGGVPMAVNADFNGDGDTTDAGDTRTFYSSYFVLDITDPEQDPVLLWTFTDATLGLGTSFPAIARVSPVADGKTDNTNAAWYAVFGSGPTGYAGSSAQKARFFVVDIARGPTYDADQTSGSLANTTSAACSTSVPCVLVNTTSSPARVRVFSTGDSNAFMGDIITLDANQDYRVDVIYAGNDIVGTTPAFVGKMYRLTTTAQSASGTPTDLATWGIDSSGARVPTTLLANFSCSGSPCTGATSVGPITMAPTVSQDTTNNIWVFFGTGRFFSTADKTNTDTQYFFGVKDDCALDTGCNQTTGPQRNNLVDVSSSAVCNPCASGTNELAGVSVGGTAVTTVDNLGSQMQSTQNLHGWFTTLPTSGERALSSPTILGGTVFFTTFVPTTDVCVAAGSGSLYALYYLTGTPYNSSTIGTTTSGGSTMITRSIALGTGMPSQMAVQIGSQGSGTSGTGGSGSGCAGRVTGYIQASTGVLGQVCGKPALSVYSRMVSWRDL
jgi:type IV pilus assembly protein PilY1